MSNVSYVIVCVYRPDHAMLNMSLDPMAGAEVYARKRNLFQCTQGVLVMSNLIAHGFYVLVSILILTSSSLALSLDGELHEWFSHMQ